MKGSPSVNHPWFRALTNRIFLRAAGGPQRQRILEPTGPFPASRQLQEAYPAIRSEVESLLARRSIPTYARFDPVRAAQVSEDWKLYYAYMYGQPNDLARDDLPTLLAFAESHPNVINAFVSILDPGVNLPAHRDPYAGMMRYHLGILIPQRKPPRIRVDREYYTWKEGEGVVLDVSFEHEVVNDSGEPRVIVIVDFRRPMWFGAELLNRYCLWMKRRWAPMFVDAARYDVAHEL